MATVVIAKAAVDAMPRDIQLRLVELPLFCSLGSPAVYTDGSLEWNLYDDHRWSLLDAARGARAFANWQDCPKADVQEWADSLGAVVPAVVPEGEDPFSFTLAQNKAPAELQMWVSKPDSMKPVES